MPIPVLQTLSSSISLDSLFVSNSVDYASTDVDDMALLIRTVTLASFKHEDMDFDNAFFSKMTALLGLLLSSGDQLLSALGPPPHTHTCTHALTRTCSFHKVKL